MTQGCKIALMLRHRRPLMHLQSVSARSRFTAADRLRLSRLRLDPRSRKSQSNRAVTGTRLLRRALLCVPWILPRQFRCAPVFPVRLMLPDLGSEEFMRRLSESLQIRQSAVISLSVLFFFPPHDLNLSAQWVSGSDVTLTTVTCCCTGLHICFPRR